ncbi:hypothetical protein [Herpetosiphon geysericola]|uniref:Uncharacterized protein n=1 Tax=Herpetosiphon geysericola TaxID=70996 RepID=A0A0P6XMX7_9CHLR|nr:hypothetical protein [Herpetosiphon geysericola]KPL84909.1 hypothetical protein SE18_18675 [Herpetosiphon geysericola]
MNNTLCDYLWAQLQPLFIALEYKIRAQFQVPIFTNIHMYYNDSLTFCSSLGFGKTQHSDWIVFEVDIDYIDSGLELEGFIIHNHNPLRIAGPSYIFTTNNPMSKALIDAWIGEFKAFIDRYADHIKPIIESMES